MSYEAMYSDSLLNEAYDQALYDRILLNFVAQWEGDQQQQQPLLNKECVDDPDFYSMVEECGDDLDHLALEYQHRHRDTARVLDPNVPPLP